jgi:two-component system osmolarity sensor histidine kinase EnvZ
MRFDWLKRYLPRGLYGRAALILILPVVTLQLVVSVVFIQRHFDGVTRQMTQTAAREIALVLSALEAGQSDTIARALNLRLTPDADPPARDVRRWYDFTGIVVIATFRAVLPDIEAIVLTDDRSLTLYLAPPSGPLAITLERRRVSATNPHQLFVNMLFFGGLMTLIAFIYLRNQLRPIARLAEAAEAFGRGRVIAYRPAGAAEVRIAGAAFLDMRARIERQIEQRTLMLSGVSHDLRTPLTRLKLGLSLMDDPALAAERAAMERDVAEMARMIDEFLSFARDASEGDPEAVDPVALVQGLVADHQRAGRAVRLAQVEGAGQVMLRAGPFRRAVDNLIGNAVRHGTHVEVSVLLSDRALRVRVEDDGPGIPAGQRGEAVRPFVRLDTARNQNAGTAGGAGVGLGLAIATDVARAHGGTLRLGESATLGGLRADIVIGR